jgi:hypothetical protein
MKVLFISLIIIILVIISIKKNNTKLIKMINPSDYILTNDLIDERDKYDLTKNMLKNINASSKVYKILKDIKTKINKNLVYGIKNKDNNYRIEIYLYGKEPNELNYQNKNNNKFINDVNKLLQYFNHNIENKINKIFNDRNVILVSFDIDLQGNFNNKIHLYVKSNIDDEIINHINFIKTSNYTLDYDIIKDTIEDESFFTRINNFEELKTVLNYYKNIKGYKINIDYFMKELLKINAKSTNLMFHYKFYNNSIGIYFIDNHINIVNNFLKIYDYPFKIDESIYKKLKLDIAINYIINENRINGTGFSDFI